jgi:hypothetical protein
METKCKLPRSRQPATCPCSEPDPSSPRPSPSHILKIHVNIISNLCLGIQSGLFPSGFPQQTPLCVSQFPHACYLSHQSHSSLFHHPSNIWYEVQIIKILILLCSPLPCFLVLPRTNPILNTLFSNILGLWSSFVVSDHVAHPCKTTGKINL